MMTGEITRRGLLLVLSSPSGAGKTTITRRLVERDAELAVSVSVTTRAPRAGMSHWAESAYGIVNRDLGRSVAEVQASLTAERLKRARQAGLAEFVNRLRVGGSGGRK